MTKENLNSLTRPNLMISNRPEMMIKLSGKREFAEAVILISPILLSMSRKEIQKLRKELR